MTAFPHARLLCAIWTALALVSGWVASVRLVGGAEQPAAQTAAAQPELAGEPAQASQHASDDYLLEEDTDDEDLGVLATGWMLHAPARRPSRGAHIALDPPQAPRTLLERPPRA